MNPIHTTLHNYETINRRCENYDKKKLNTILRNDINESLGNMRLFFANLIFNTPNSISEIVKPLSLDLKVWNSLTSRVTLLLKHKYEQIKNISSF